MTPEKFHVRVLPGDVRVVELFGRLDIGVVDEVQAFAERLFEKTPAHVIVDLGRVVYFPSSAVALLYRLSGKVEKAGKKFGILSPSAEVRAVMDLVGGARSSRSAATSPIFARPWDSRRVGCAEKSKRSCASSEEEGSAGDDRPLHPLSKTLRAV